MQSLLTLSVGDYRSVELLLRLTVVLGAMTALILVGTLSCVPARFRFPIILSSAGLLGAAWFESGVWQGWKGAFELAGTSYCVTGQLLAGEDRIIAWALGVPAILTAFALLMRRLTPKLLVLMILLALLAPFTATGAMVLLLICSWVLGAKGENGGKPFFLGALTSILLALAINLIGGFHLIPLGVSAGEILVRGEILHSLCDLLSLVIPSLLLLSLVLKESREE